MATTQTATDLNGLIEAAAELAVLADAQDKTSVDELSAAMAALAKALAGAGRPKAAAACNEAAQSLAGAPGRNNPGAALQAVSTLIARAQTAMRANSDLGDDAPEPEQPDRQSAPKTDDAAADSAPPLPQNKQPAALAKAMPGRYLIFRLGHEEFGLEILKVQEIVSLLDITRVPHTLPFLKGVCNLRGQVIPVMDWRLKFDMEEAPPTPKTCMIVVKVTHNGKTTIIAGVLDEVAEALDLSANAIEPAPPFGAGVDARFLSGMGKIDKRIVLLIEVERALSIEELTGSVM